MKPNIIKLYKGGKRVESHKMNEPFSGEVHLSEAEEVCSCLPQFENNGRVIPDLARVYNGGRHVASYRILPLSSTYAGVAYAIKRIRKVG